MPDRRYEVRVTGRLSRSAARDAFADMEVLRRERRDGDLRPGARGRAAPRLPPRRPESLGLHVVSVQQVPADPGRPGDSGDPHVAPAPLPSRTIP